MGESIRKNRAAIRSLVASAGERNPQLKVTGQRQILEMVVDPLPGIRAADLHQLQINLEEVLRTGVDVSIPAHLGGRQRAATLQRALPI